MIGAIIGDVVGSRFEWNNRKSRDFTFFGRGCGVTDDSIMTLAVAKAILESKKDPERLSESAVKWMQKLGREDIDAGYGGRFLGWLLSDDPMPYNSFGNGAAMRVSPCGFAAESIEEAKYLARIVTEVSHDHPEALKAAEAVSVAIYMALRGSSMQDIRDAVERNYYRIDFTIDGIRDSYRFDVSCQGSVPQAFAAFFESTDFESAIRNAVSIGGDSDTIAAIAGSMAEALYGVPADIRACALTYLNDEYRAILEDFEQAYPCCR